MRKQTYCAERRYEVRRYWYNGVVMDSEFWQNGQIALALPQHLPAATITVDRCATHGSYIYADLPCRICQERPRVVPMRTGAPAVSAA